MRAYTHAHMQTHTHTHTVTQPVTIYRSMDELQQAKKYQKYCRQFEKMGFDDSFKGWSKMRVADFLS